MDEKQASETIQNFADMVKATEKLISPWRRALVITNAFWAAAFVIFILLAYLTPDTSYQVQDYESQHMSQSVGTEVVTQGD